MEFYLADNGFKGFYDNFHVYAPAYMYFYGLLDYYSAVFARPGISEFMVKYGRCWRI